MIQIKSPSNPKIKHLVRLRKSSRYRHEVGQFIVEGDREMEALFSFGRELKEIYFTNDALKNSPLSHVLPKLSQYISIFEVNEACMKKISYKDQTSNIVGVANTWKLRLVENKASFRLVLVLDEIEKPGNLGAILRTAEAMGVDAIILSESKVDFFNPNVVRSSMGLFAKKNVFKGSKIEVVEWLKKQNLDIIGTSSAANDSIHNHIFKSGTAVIMGSESHGLGEFWEDHIKDMLYIPMKGKASSLNLNSATACILMEFNRNLG